MKKYSFISFGNYVDDKNMEPICEALENGEVVHPCCSCIGHTRAFLETTRAHDYLYQKYGSRLILIEGEDAEEFKDSWGCVDTPLYRLKKKE